MFRCFDVLTLFCHELFEFYDMVRDALVAQEATAVLGNQHVVLDADATKVLVGLQLVEVEEILAVAAGFPLVDEGRDESQRPLQGFPQQWPLAFHSSMRAGMK